jgi:hypothetical protein
MNARERLSAIEYLSKPNEVQLIPMPALALTDADYKAADSELDNVRDIMRQASGETNVQSISALMAVIQKRDIQFKDALHTLAVTKADLNDSNDIIKQWRAHSGFTSDDEGVIHYTPPAHAA